MVDAPLTVSQKIWHPLFAVSLAVCFLGGAGLMIAEGVGRYREEQVLQWIKFLPLLLCIGLAFLFFAIKSIVMLARRYDPESPGAYRAPVFRFENRLVTFLIFCGIAAPFLLQPIVDYAVMPALGFEYCEARSSQGSTFGFPTNAYVADPALCAPPRP